jgi:hypothetical protein
VQVAENVEFPANLRFPKPIVSCGDERYHSHIENILVNRGTPRGTSRTPCHHRVGDLGGTWREPTAHEGSRTKYRAGSTKGRFESATRESRRVPTSSEIKASCFEAISFISYRPKYQNIVNIRSGIKDPKK